MVMGRTRPYRDEDTLNAQCKRCGVLRTSKRTRNSDYCADCLYPAQIDGWTPRRGMR